jgi:hypothetical protein
MTQRTLKYAMTLSFTLSETWITKDSFNNLIGEPQENDQLQVVGGG